MDDLILRIGGISLGVGAGLAWGWASGRIFGRALLQDISAVSVATLLGYITLVVVQVAKLVSSTTGGLGAVSAGVSGFALVGLPVITIMLAVAGQVVRWQLGGTRTVPLALGGLAALVGALWASATIGPSVN